LPRPKQVWVDGMRVIDRRAAQFPGNGPVVNDFFGVVGGAWRVYVGRPAVSGGDAFAFAFNTGRGTVLADCYPAFGLTPPWPVACPGQLHDHLP